MAKVYGPIKIKEPEGLKKTFYDIYNDGLITGHIAKKSLRQKIERFRNEMAVGFYDLEQTDQQIAEFAEEYMGYSSETIHTSLFEATSAEIDTLVFVQTEQPQYKAILDKLLVGEEPTEEEILYIQKRLCGEVFKHQQPSGRWVLTRSSYFHNWGLLRALYEFVILVSRKAIAVGRCSAPNCNRIFLETGGGSEQLYCSRACKMRAYRKRKRREAALV